MVRKGEHGTAIVYADRFTPEAEKSRAGAAGEDPRSIPFLRRFTVFNVAQVDGLPDTCHATSAPPDPSLILPAAQAVIDARGVPFLIGGDRAFYAPCRDTVLVPPPAAFFEPVNWHRTALHELTHVTGHDSRLGQHRP